MPEILHRISIDASINRVHDLIASTEGIARWWTGRPLEGAAEVGHRFSLFFGNGTDPSAVMQVVKDNPDIVTWRVERGPDSWVGTTITFDLRPHGDSGTTLLFTHAGWAETSEFMAGCTSNWGAYLTSLKNGAETGDFAAFPHGEISRWG